jgi:hypothetical protein
MNTMRVILLLWLLLPATERLGSRAAEVRGNPTSDAESIAVGTSAEEAAYARAIASRAEKIVANLALVQEEQAQRVRQLIADQYRGLRAIHDLRDETLTRLRHDSSRAPGSRDAADREVRQGAQLKQFELHRQFVARLTAELTPEQVTQVKDGMTYGVVPATYGRYLQLLPELSEEQRVTILALLIEAREYAMDGGSSEEKHHWFRKYKGKINNYLSAAGVNLSEAEARAQGTSQP